jgi:hypothetical protein
MFLMLTNVNVSQENWLVLDLEKPFTLQARTSMVVSLPC